ncbi:MAG: polyamine aminopropyltransferase, partial [Cyanobacteriota bacterium]
MPPTEPPAPGADTSQWVDEELNGVRYGLAASVIAERQSDYQRVTIIDSQSYGKGLLLDG